MPPPKLVAPPVDRRAKTVAQMAIFFAVCLLWGEEGTGVLFLVRAHHNIFFSFSRLCTTYSTACCCVGGRRLY